MRIVSLLPSATDIVCSIGLRDSLVGRTHECDWPPGVEDVSVMTADALDTSRRTSREIEEAIGTAVHSGSSIYTLDVEALEAARPDLILTQEMCEVCAVSYRDVARAARVLQVGPTILSLEPRSISDVLGHVRLVGRVAGADDQARDVVADARERLERLHAATASLARVRTVCIEWLDPVYAAGHWVHEQVSYAGGEELLGPRGGPSVAIEWDEVTRRAPDALVLMPCGMPIARTMREIHAVVERPGFDELPAVRSGRVWAVDGSSFFNRPGPRLVRGAEILAALLHGVGEVSADEARTVRRI